MIKHIVETSICYAHVQCVSLSIVDMLFSLPQQIQLPKRGDERVQHVPWVAYGSFMTPDVSQAAKVIITHHHYTSSFAK